MSEHDFQQAKLGYLKNVVANQTIKIKIPKSNKDLWGLKQVN